MSKALTTIGLCRRAGKLIYGFDAVAEAVKPPDSKVGGVLTASDLSEKTKKEVRYECGKANVPVTELPETLDDIKQVTGKRTGVLAVLDDGLYKSVVNSISQ